MRRAIVGLIVAVAIAATVPFAAAGATGEELVSECHREVKGRVRLTSDLLCPGGSVRGVALLMKRGRLYLDGHAIVHQPGAGKQNGIQCNRRCTIVGPGVISGFDLSAAITAVGAIRLENVSVMDNDVDGVRGNRLIRIESSTIERNSRAGVSAHERVRLENTVVAENQGFGVLDPTSELCNPGPNGVPHAYGCADVQATSKSSVDGTLVCGTSLEFDTPNTLGICADD